MVLVVGDGGIRQIAELGSVVGSSTTMMSGAPALVSAATMLLPIIPAPPVTTIMWVSRLRFRSKRFRAQGEALCVLAKRPGRPTRTRHRPRHAGLRSPDEPRQEFHSRCRRPLRVDHRAGGRRRDARPVHSRRARQDIARGADTVLQARGEETMLGGAGNVVANIASLGGKARLCAVIGDDAPGNAVLGCCRPAPSRPPACCAARRAAPPARAATSRRTSRCCASTRRHDAARQG